MKLNIKKATTSKLIEVFISDSSSTTGSGLTGLVYNSSSLTAYYMRNGASSAVSITLVTMTLGTWVSGGFVEVDAVNMPGVYQVGLPNAIIALGVDSVVLHFKGATNMAPLPLELQLVSYDPNDAIRMGLTALPNAVSNAAGGLPISIAGGLNLDTQLANTNEITAVRMATLTDWINGGRLDLILDIIAADVINIDGASMRGTDSAALASAWTATRAGYVDNLNGHTAQTGDTFAQLPTNFSALSISITTGLVDITQAAADKVWSTTARTLTSFGTLVSDIWSNSTRTLTAFSTSLAISIWDVLETAILTVSSIGLKVKNNLDVAVSSRSDFDEAINDVTVGTNNDKIGYLISGTKTTLDTLNDVSTSQVNTEVDTALNTAIPASPIANSINERIGAIDALIEASGNGDLAAIKTIIDNLPNSGALSDLALILTEVGGLNGDAMRGTDSAALASVATEVRLAELDAANIPSDLSDIQGTTFNSTTDSLESIRDRGDSAWVTGGGGSNPVLLQSTTIATLTSQTSFTLTAGSSDNGAYNDAVIVITDSTSSEQKAFSIVSNFVGATKSITLSSDPGIFIMAIGDIIDIIAIPKIIPTVTVNTDMRGTDGANTIVPDAAGVLPTAIEIRQEVDTNSTNLNQIITDIAAVKTDTASILIDTNELQGDWTNGGRLDVILDAILLDTGTDGVVLTAVERTAIADAILDRDMSIGTDSGTTTSRTVRQSLRSGRNKISISGGIMTVYKEDDTTVSWTASITTAAGNPISGIDPAG